LLEVIFIAAIIAGVFYSLLSVIVLIYERSRAASDSASRVYSAPVTVLKPLKGADDCLEENLRSFFNLDYPGFELIFGVRDYNDPAVHIVKTLQAEYPQVCSTLVVDRFQIGLNPKINNLYNMYRRASYDHIVLSDSNIRVRPDYLTDLVNHIERPGVGLVSSLIRGVGERTYGSLLQNCHMNGFIAGSVMAARRLFNIPVTIGKSVIIKRETLERIGGLRNFANYLAEDQLMGLAVRQLGLDVKTSFHAVESTDVAWSFRMFLCRQLRWATMRRHLGLLNYFAEVLSTPIFLSLLYLLLYRTPEAVMIFAGTWVAKVALDASAFIVIGARPRLSHLLAIPVKEVLTGGLWVVPLFIRRVNWRGTELLVSDSTRLSPAPISTVRRKVAVSRAWRGVSRTGRFTVDGTRFLFNRARLSTFRHKRVA
jgi:ceramide glucosyltransferase